MSRTRVVVSEGQASGNKKELGTCKIGIRRRGPSRRWCWLELRVAHNIDGHDDGVTIGLTTGR